MKVLIVDPDPHRAPALAQALVTGGAEVTVAPNGSFALTMLEWNRHDVVISRALIDDMGGHELCAILKADPSTREVRFVLVASADEVSGVESAAGGVDLVLPPGMTGSAIVPLVVRLMRGDRTPVVPPEPPRPAADRRGARHESRRRLRPCLGRRRPAPARPLAGVPSLLPAPPPPSAVEPPKRYATAAAANGALDVEDDAGHRIGRPPAPRRLPICWPSRAGCSRDRSKSWSWPSSPRRSVLGGKSGRLILALGRGSGLIVFDAGRVVHAEYRNAVGEEAFAALLARRARRWRRPLLLRAGHRGNARPAAHDRQERRPAVAEHRDGDRRKGVRGHGQGAGGGRQPQRTQGRRARPARPAHRGGVRRHRQRGPRADRARRARRRRVRRGHARS